MIEVWTCATANGIKPLILLEELGLGYECHKVDLAKGEHLAAAMLERNPLGKVPVLYDSDGPNGQPTMMGETATMANYLVSKTGKLAPANQTEVIEIDYWCQASNATISAMMSRQFWLKFIAPEKSQALIDAGEQDCLRYFKVFDDHLTKSRNYLVGDRFTIADALFWPHTHYSPSLLSVGLSPFQALSDYHQRILARTSVQDALARLI